MIIAGAALLLVRHPAKFAFAIAVALAMLRVYPDAEEKRETVRSFFGVHKIYEAINGQYRVLIHGTTVHGGQKLKDENGQPLTGRPEMITYYHSRSPMAQAIPAIRARKGGPIRVAVVGLGAGTLACFSEPGEELALFRDRCVHHRDRARSAALHLHGVLRPGSADHPRRCPAHARARARWLLRPDHPRRLFVGRHSHPPRYP